jgi:hypothetical protein
MATAILEDAPPTADEARVIAAFVEFLKRASAKRPRGSHGEMLRFNQGRATGCVDAELVVPADLPAPLRVGLFATPGTRRAVIRFANATSTTDRDRDTRGMAIAVLDVPGANLTAGQSRQDFVLNSHPVMPAPDTREFLALLEANEAGALRRAVYFATHFGAARVALASRQHHSCHLDIPYWSTTPYTFGGASAVKYMARPTSTRTSTLPERRTDSYLRDALRLHLLAADASFDLMVQFFVDEARTPIENAMVEWTKDVAPWHTVARLRIPLQSIDDPARNSRCEQMAFNPWHALAEHRPLGNMNRARREIYRAMSEFRRGAL